MTGTWDREAENDACKTTGRNEMEWAEGGGKSRERAGGIVCRGSMMGWGTHKRNGSYLHVIGILGLGAHGDRTCIHGGHAWGLRR